MRKFLSRRSRTLTNILKVYGESVASSKIILPPSSSSSHSWAYLTSVRWSPDKEEARSTSHSTPHPCRTTTLLKRSSKSPETDKTSLYYRVDATKICVLTAVFVRQSWTKEPIAFVKVISSVLIVYKRRVTRLLVSTAEFVILRKTPSNAFARITSRESCATSKYIRVNKRTFVPTTEYVSTTDLLSFAVNVICGGQVNAVQRTLFAVHMDF